MSDPGIELGDGVCDFEKVPPDQLCPSAKRGLVLGLGIAGVVFPQADTQCVNTQPTMNGWVPTCVSCDPSCCKVQCLKPVERLLFMHYVPLSLRKRC